MRGIRLQQRHYDVLGLALAAIGVLLGFVIYAHWDGGSGGDSFARALGWLFGKARLGMPVAIGGAGVILWMRPVLPPLGALRSGAALLLAAALLILAAGSAHSFWSASFFRAHGGLLGQAELWVASQAIGVTGAHILAVFLAIAAVMLLSGGRLAVLIREGGVLAARAIRAERERAAEEARRRRAARIVPPEPEDRELIVRATHVEAPAPIEIPAFLEPDPEPQDDDAQTEDFEAVAEESSAAAIEASQLTPQGRFRASVTDDPSFDWRLPRPSLLTRSSAEQVRPDTAGQKAVTAGLLEALGHFGVQAKVIGTVTGPHITRYELRLAPGIKVSKVANLKDDLAYALAATDVRILAPIPGKQAVGVEVPNAKRRIVRLGDVYQDPPVDWSPLAVWLGKDVSGRAIGADLASMPHLLVAGTTGSGKSGAVNAMLSSILLRATPHDVRLVLIDPKQVELNHYESIPHLLTPVITNPRMAANALGNLVREMEQRYGMMSLARTRSLVELNRVRAERGDPALPYILCVIDELADLMMVAPADVETAIIRLAQKARAVGIHLVLATQSPRVDVITGLIKANVPSRIAFAVSSQTDSRVILDQNGAESLLGAGDMLFSPIGSSAPQRIQGAYIDEGQIANLTEFWRRQGEPEFQAGLLEDVEPAPAEEGREDGFDPDEDPLLEDAIALVVEMGVASTSMLQRRMRLGYTRAGRLIDMLERRGIVSEFEGSKPRQVLVSEADLPQVLAALGSRSSSPAGEAGDDSPA
ncbi:MAG TPA: DNA translocase FtsK [Solirubrobacteraceae bacterium]|nr:DNA translocase FtsK [Solirubrobacteraceae bacterium]